MYWICMSLDKILTLIASYSLYAEMTTIVFFSLKTQTIKLLEHCCYHIHGYSAVKLCHENVYQIYKFRSRNLINRVFRHIALSVSHFYNINVFIYF